MECFPPPDSLLPIGPTTVTCEAVDPLGRSAECTFVVTVLERPELEASCIETVNPSGGPLAHRGPAGPAVPAGTTPPGNEGNGRGAATGDGNGPPATTNADGYFVTSPNPIAHGAAPCFGTFCTSRPPVLRRSCAPPHGVRPRIVRRPPAR